MRIAVKREELEEARRRDPWYVDVEPSGGLRRPLPMSKEQQQERQRAALVQAQEKRKKAIAALGRRQIVALRAVATSSGLDDIDAFTFDVLARIGLLIRRKGSKSKADWQLTDEGRAAVE